jgi:hypothetical protein
MPAMADPGMLHRSRSVVVEKNKATKRNMVA